MNALNLSDVFSSVDLRTDTGKKMEKMERRRRKRKRCFIEIEPRASNFVNYSQINSKCELWKLMCSLIKEMKIKMVVILINDFSSCTQCVFLRANSHLYGSHFLPAAARR